LIQILKSIIHIISRKLFYVVNKNWILVDVVSQRDLKILSDYIVNKIDNFTVICATKHNVIMSWLENSIINAYNKVLFYNKLFQD